MKLLVVNKNSMWRVVFTIQMLLLVSYLSLNIVSVGEMGTALPLLAAFVGMAAIHLFFKVINNTLTIKYSFFIFLMFVTWLSFRIAIDLSDLNYIKNITVATTGGVLLFFLLGSFSREALDKLVFGGEIKQLKTILMLSTLSTIFVFFSFKGRLLEREDIFLISDVDGSYQRPGNFMIIIFLLISFVYLCVISSFVTRKIRSFIIWFFLYAVSTVLSLISSQMMGSNAATACILAVFSMATVISFLSFNSKLRYKFLNQQLSLPFSKSGSKKIISYSLIFLVLGVTFATLFIQAIDFDLSKTRAFGFGSGENRSVGSRLEILMETGLDQIAYSPIVGNVNVAYLTTGRAGRTLHNFIPNVIAELGLIGLFIVTVLFIVTAQTLISRVKNNRYNGSLGFTDVVLNFWLLFVFAFLLLYANIATGKSWPVMWFFVGFSVNVFEGEFSFLKENSPYTTSKIAN